MLYLLDTNVLITANNLYYPVERVPEFWHWLRHVSADGLVKMPQEMFDEVKDGRKDGKKDLLFGWLQTPSVKDSLLMDEEADEHLVRSVMDVGYAADLTDDEIPQLGNDPFLIAYALADVDNRCVVTTEVSKPKRKRQNRHIPDVCQTMGVKCIDTFELLRILDFSTSWASGRR
jgi:hypothetical protein